ncbi:MAG: hypothetical protein QOJ94_1262 [Sphingomonadales bacterium]|jgi:hypothetical protein|nr:hypothetical protein [Sphingomonadales bacterium]
MNFLTPIADERVADVRFGEAQLVVELMNGRTIAVPLAWYPRLFEATPAQRANWQRAGGGYGIHWPEIDEDLAVEGLLRGAPAPGSEIGMAKVGEISDEDALVSVFSSTAIERARFSLKARTLDIWYKGGDRYTYFDVPMETYQTLRSASSAGEFVNREIKPRYRYEIEERRRRFRPG